MWCTSSIRRRASPSTMPIQRPTWDRSCCCSERSASCRMPTMLDSGPRRSCETMRLNDARPSTSSSRWRVRSCTRFSSDWFSSRSSVSARCRASSSHRRSRRRRRPSAPTMASPSSACASDAQPRNGSPVSPRTPAPSPSTITGCSSSATASRAWVRPATGPRHPAHRPARTTYGRVEATGPARPPGSNACASASRPDQATPSAANRSPACRTGRPR